MNPSLYKLGAALILSIAACRRSAPTPEVAPPPTMLLRADRVFDGNVIRTESAVLLEGRRVKGVGSPSELHAEGVKTLDLGDATILPGFIEPHAHSLRAGVPSDVVLRHGITTIRDLGGPLRSMSGGEGSLRLLTSGPILTAPGGYPIPAFGEGDLARAVDSEESGRAAVRDLASGGASVIKIALEPGFEPGAPWTRHGHGAGHSAAGAAPSAWPLMPLATVRAIVEEAHRQGRKTIAHAGEERGVAIALDAGVDEWAHVPCSRVSDALLRRAAEQGVVVVTTIDTLSACPGVAENARKLIEFGATLIYGAEIAHGDVPWGVDAEELNAMRAAGMEPLAILRAATSRSAEALGLAPLGTLAPGAPADLVAVRGDALRDYKRLEYPDLVISGGEVIVDWNRATAARDRYPEKGGPTPVPSPPGA